MNTDKPNKEFDRWLIKSILNMNNSQWHPTEELFAARVLLEIYLDHNTDKYTHVELAYDSTDDFPWIVYIVPKGEYAPSATGYPLALVICQALQKAIEHLSTERQE